MTGGYSVAYLTEQVATGRENYYTGAVAAGEPPGRWSGRGAQALGLTGLVDATTMAAVYERFLDPRDPAFKDESRWDEVRTLGHAGRAYKTERELYAEALNAEPYADAERRTELWAEAGRNVRKNVAFLDATFSVQKSVTVLHTAFEHQQVQAERRASDESLPEVTRAAAREQAAAWSRHRQAVEDAIWAGNNAALTYLAEHAGFSRVGHHGGAAGRWIDAHDLVVASFFQHDSRDHDPQLHIHNAILNRALGADGQWRTLDSRAFYKYRGAAGAVAERVMEAHLTASLGVRFATRPDGKAREILGVPQAAMDLFSTRRTRGITPKTQQLVIAFEDRYGRSPTSLELTRLQQEATLATRRGKSHVGETTEQRLDRWGTQLQGEIDGGMATVARDALHAAQQPRTIPTWSKDAVIATALAEVQATKAAWSPPDLTRALSNALPDDVGDLDAEQITTLLDGLTAEALTHAVRLDPDPSATVEQPAELRLANGASAYEGPGRGLYATAEQVRDERLLHNAAHVGDAPVLAPDTAQAVVTGLAELGIELGADQAAAVRGILTSTASVETLIGPAGAGKSFVLGTLTKAWQDPTLWEGKQHRVVGLAPSQIAADVLTGEGVPAMNTARWLATQHRLDEDRPRGEDTRWRLSAGDLVVVDEASMATTADLAKIHRHATAAGAKLLITGDHRQLAAVGAAGGMELLTAAGPAYELTEARRFEQEWERTASLRLRAADPTVLVDYHRHGRLLDSGTVEDAEASATRAWLADTLAGKRSVLVVDTNDQADRLSAAIRAQLVSLGVVAEEGVSLDRQGTIAGVGDLVQARRLAWELAGHDGNTTIPVNRQQYRVLETRPDGSLRVAPVLTGPAVATPNSGGGEGEQSEQLGQPLTVPASYVQADLTLGYAATVHAVQGVTVDTSHSVITPTSSAPGVHVAMTRGRHANTAHVVTTTVPTDTAQGTDRDEVHRSALATLGGILDHAEDTREHSALATAAQATADAESIRTPAERFSDGATLACATRTAQHLDQLVAEGHLTTEERTRLAVEDATPTLARLLRRVELAGGDPQQVLTHAVTSKPLTGARSLTHVLHHRITTTSSLDPVGDAFADRVPHVNDPVWQRMLVDLAHDADARRDSLGAQAATTQPGWAVTTLGVPPEDPEARSAWSSRAGIVAAHRELAGLTDEDPTVLGRPPKPGQVDAYAAWRAAWRALDRPEEQRDELEMSDGQLRMRVRAYQREEAWAPRYVANELAGTHQALTRHDHTATLRHAEAEAATDPATRDRLHHEARQARELADVLRTRLAELSQIDAARATWYAHTSETRAAAQRATTELQDRHSEDAVDHERVTAEEWLAAHAAAMRAEDPHRTITETDLAEQRSEATPDTDDTGTAEVEVVDLRHRATTELPQRNEDQVRVPDASETAAALTRARRALVEITARDAADADQLAEDEHSQQLAHWHAEEHSATVEEPHQIHEATRDAALTRQ